MIDLLTLRRWLTFLLVSLTVTLIVLLFWIYFFPLMLVIVLQWLSLHWEILIILLSQIWLTFHQTQDRMPCFITQLMTILELIRMVLVINWEMFHGRISLNLVLLLLLVNFGSGFWCKLMYISLVVSIRSSLTSLHALNNSLILFVPTE